MSFQWFDDALPRALNDRGPYHPGSESRLYERWPKNTQTSVNQEVNFLFRKHLGLSRELDPKRDLLLVRAWLRVRDLVVSRRLAYRGQHIGISHRWAIYAVDLKRNMFEIDIMHSDTYAPVIHPIVALLLFRKGYVPKGVVLTKETFDKFDRWRIEWKPGVNIANELYFNFCVALTVPENYGEQWRQKRLAERFLLQVQHVRRLIWYFTPKKWLGGRSPSSLSKLRPGPYEVKGQGFLSITSRDFTFKPYSDMENQNEGIRWFLRHGVDIFNAVVLQERQQKGLLRQALTASVLIMSPGLKLRPYGPAAQRMAEKVTTSLERVYEEGAGNFDHVKTLITGPHDELLTIMLKQVAGKEYARAEAEIQELGRRGETAKIVVLEPLPGAALH